MTLSDGLDVHPFIAYAHVASVLLVGSGPNGPNGSQSQQESQQPNFSVGRTAAAPPYDATAAPVQLNRTGLAGGLANDRQNNNGGLLGAGGSLTNLTPLSSANGAPAMTAAQVVERCVQSLEFEEALCRGLTATLLEVVVVPTSATPMMLLGTSSAAAGIPMVAPMVLASASVMADFATPARVLGQQLLDLWGHR
jgi:hypothetical protein